MITAVMTYNHREVFLSRESLQYIVGKALSGHTYDINIHAVGACSHDTTKSTSAKLK